MAEPEAGDGVRPPGELQAELALLSQGLVALGRQVEDGALAAALAGVAAVLRELDEAGGALGQRAGWWERLVGGAGPGYLATLDRAAVEMDGLAGALTQKERRLRAGLRALQGLQDRADRLGRELAEQAQALDARLAEAGPDGATRGDLERRLHDLRLTRTVLAGTAAGIGARMEAEALVAQRMALLRTEVLPGWEAQMAPLIAAARAAPGQRLAPEELARLRAASGRLLAALAASDFRVDAGEGPA